MQYPLRFIKLKRSGTINDEKDEHDDILCSNELQYTRLELKLTKVCEERLKFDFF